jgi:antitoxin CptB
MQKMCAPEDPDSKRVERLRWRSRRGLLELELLLAPFIEELRRHPDSDLLDLYEPLLDCDDLDIHAWLLDRSDPPAEFYRIVTEIREYLARDRDRG